MASSDDEDETVPHTVSDYHFVDYKDEPISFSELPVQWSEAESLDIKKTQIFLHGFADNGLQKIYKQVIAWKFDLSKAKPEISVLSKDNNFIKLQKPRKCFEDTIRTILITVHFLHFLKKTPEASGRALWDHLSKVLSFNEVGPSESDLLDHMNLISEAVKRDEVLAKSKFLVTFLEQKPKKRKALDKDIGNTAKSMFIVDDDAIDETEEDGPDEVTEENGPAEEPEEEGSDEEGDLFDSVCSICDNGGNILCCEGRCLRSFHATEEDGADSTCESLGFSNEQVEAIQSFFCKNCQYKKHQCFSCGELGSSDKSSGAEVFQCVSATCGRFYHPHCVAKLLHRDSVADAKELQKKIAAGEAFTCPVHKCCVCKEGENKTVPELQFAMCRRCPKSYHRKCLPRKIAFEDLEDEDIIQRAWEELMPNRILIYCLKHEIDDEIGTPIRNHIKFPNVGQKKIRQPSELLPSREKVTSEDAFRKKAIVRPPKGSAKLSSAIKQGDSSKKSEGLLARLESSKKQKLSNTSQKPVNKISSPKVIKSTTDKNKTSLGDRLYAFLNEDSEPGKSRKDDTTDSGDEQTRTVKPAAKESSSSLPLDADSKTRILTLMKDVTSSITLEKITEKHKLPITHTYSSRNVVDKTITLGKVEGSIEALRAALQKLEEGCSIEDAKAVCEPGLLNQIVKWKHKLKVYLAPFLFGMRYTSFGRHFTKVDKLKEIVEMLRWYVQDGDTIVDFCCGANDFSIIMKKRLDEMGKKCSYKNYDLLQTKNDFNFEKRDWMSVRPKELPAGGKLIMGLNPPFGFNASLANKFVDKALEFKPKLLILIVPPETKRLDEKKTPYDLVWEDDELLAGKAFYFPGSVDVNDKQIEQWNVTTPPLYLWSRQDWTAKHKAIAQQHGHLSKVREESRLVENHHEEDVSDFPMEHHELNGETPMLLDDHPVQNEEPEQLQERAATVTESHKEGFPHDNGGTKGGKNLGHEKNRSNENPKKRNRGKGKRERVSGEIPPKDRQKGSSPLPRDSQSNMTGNRSTDSRSPPKPLETPSHTDTGIETHQHFDRSVSGSHSQFGTEQGGIRDDDMSTRYNANSDDPYSGLTYRRSNVASLAPDYAVRNSEEQFSGYRRQIMDNRGYGSYVDEMDVKYGSRSDIQPQVPHFGRYSDSLTQRSSYLAGHDPGFSTPYGLPGSAANTSYNRMSTSAMQRYAPRLDELNHTRMNNSGPELSSVNINGGYDPLAPRPGVRMDSLGFAPGPYRPPFPHQNSSGWLNE